MNLLTSNQNNMRRSNSFIIGILFVILTQFISFGSRASDEIISDIASTVMNNLDVGTSIYACDLRYSDMQFNPDWQDHFVNYSTSGRVEFGILEKNIAPESAFTATILVNIKYSKYNYELQQFEVFFENKELTIDYNTTGSFNNLELYEIEGAQQIKVTVIDLDVTSGTNINYFLKTVIDVERYYTLDATEMPDVSHSTSLVATKNELKINWNYIEGAEEYDLEWVYVDDYDVNEYNGNILDELSASEINIDERLFEFNSTRITTSDNSYKIPLIFDRGYILYRVRPVGIVVSGSEKITVFGAWSDMPGNETVADWSDKYYITSGLDQNLNWQANISFAEEGKNKAVVSYFDGSLRTRQQVTKSNTSDEVIVGETYYDHEGRPVVTSMPVPANSMMIEYIENFNQGSAVSGDQYTFFNNDEDFDIDIINGGLVTLGANEMSGTSGAANYYSSGNPNTSGYNAYIPDAQGYPLQQVVYDNYGRVSMQGGVGPDHQVGSGHETKYYYRNAYTEELDRLFGNDAGFSNHYQRTMIFDPNGQASVSYTDISGKVVATGLIGESPETLEEIGGQQSQTMVVDLLELDPSDPSNPGNRNLVNEETMSREMVTSIQPSNDGETWEFQYSLANTEYVKECENITGGSLCLDCVFDLEISLRDRFGNDYLYFEEISEGNYRVKEENIGYPDNSTCNSVEGFDSQTDVSEEVWSQPISLETGDYILTKKLILNEARLEEYTDQYIQTMQENDCLLDEEYFITEESDVVFTDGCFSTCQECAAYVATLYPEKITLEEKNQLLEECYVGCQINALRIESGYEAMLMDMSPHGQYGQVSSGGVFIDGVISELDDEEYPVQFALSVFNESNRLPVKWNGNFFDPSDQETQLLKPNWRYPVNLEYTTSQADLRYNYLDENGDVAKVILESDGEGNYIPKVRVDFLLEVDVNTETGEISVEPKYLEFVTDFIQNWEYSWAKSLVYYHPEYGYYEFYKSIEESELFDNFFTDYINTTTDLTNIAGFEDDFETNPLTSDLVDGPSNWYTDDDEGISGLIQWDPFFATGAPGEDWRDQMSDKLQEYTYDESGNPVSVWELIYLVTNFVDIDNTNCSTPNYTGPYTFTTNEEWQLFKGLYFSAKNEIVNKAAAQYAISVASDGFNDGNNYCYNGCIGKETFDFTDNGFLSESYSAHVDNPLNGFSFWTTYGWQSFNFEQPCNLFYYRLYKDKTPRFPSSGDIMNDQSLVEMLSLSQPGSCARMEIAEENLNLQQFVHYSQTGQCPIAVHLEGLINALIVNDALMVDPTQLTCNYPEFNDDMRDLLGFSESEIVRWDLYTTSSTQIQAMITNQAISNYHYVSLTVPSPHSTYYDLSDITRVCCLQSTDGYNFTLVATVDIDPNDTEYYDPTGMFTTRDIVITGTFDDPDDIVTLTNCEFDPICRTSQLGNDMKNLFNGLISGGTFTSTNWVDLGNAPYVAMITDNIREGFYADLDDELQYKKVTTLGTGSIEVKFQNTTNSHTESIYLSMFDMDGNSLSTVAWADLDKIDFVKPLDGTSPNFQAVGTTSDVNYSCIIIRGTTNLDFGTCSDEVPEEYSLVQSTADYVNSGNLTCETNQIGLLAEIELNDFDWSELSDEESFDITIPVTVEYSIEANVYTWFEQGPYTDGGYHLSQIESVYGLQPDQHSLNADGSTNFFVITAVLTSGVEVILHGEIDLNIGSCLPVQNSTCSLSDESEYMLNLLNGATQFFDDVAISSPYTGPGFSIAFDPDDIYLELESNELDRFVHKGSLSGDCPVFLYMPLNSGYEDFAQVQYFSHLTVDYSNLDEGESHGFNIIAHMADGNLVRMFGYTDCFVTGNCNECEDILSEQNWDFNDYYNADMCGNYAYCDLSEYSELTNFGFTSGYIYDESNTSLGENSYQVGPNFITPHSSSYCFVANGGQNPNSSGDLTYAWVQEVSVEPFVEYNFSFWAAEYLDGGNPKVDLGILNNEGEFTSVFALGRVYLDDVLVPASEYVEISGTTWHKVTGVFNTMANTTIKLAILSYSASDNGNYFAIDDISAFSVGSTHCSPDYLCGAPMFPTFSEEIDPCADISDYLDNVIAFNAHQNYEEYIEGEKQKFREEYIQKCLSVQETFKMENINPYGEHHYTLYYYDQAGNLVKTIPPTGVVPLDNSVLNDVKEARNNPDDPTNYPPVFPDHKFATTYMYNSLNQLVANGMPDQDVMNTSSSDQKVKNFTVRTWYDKLGRIVLSQNSNQYDDSETNHKYSYSVYDLLGRVVESGQLQTTVSINNILSNGQVNYNDETLGTNQTYLEWIENTGNIRTEVSQVYYTQPLFTMSVSGFSQENLMTRVAASTYEDLYDMDDLTYNSATHYSYDIHGNVNAMLQDIGYLEEYGSKYKLIKYEYDLVSGNVNKVSYQQGQPDQFYHKYEYDADNRIIQVLISTDNINWEKDAGYQYYKHGPLARIELGKNKVQGLDYAYNLQGWIKGVNSNTLTTNRDIGKDGSTLAFSPHMFFAPDEFGFTLNYFAGDYSAIGTMSETNRFEATPSTSTGFVLDRNLFNGNIGAMVTAIKHFMESGNEHLGVQGMKYTYDQLQRLRASEMHNNINLTANTWGTNVATSLYRENLTYDANGNIQTLVRTGEAGTNIDQLSYSYYENSEGSINRLKYVADNSASNLGLPTGQSDYNYDYDELGNLIADENEDIANIEWTVTGKVKKVTHNNPSTGSYTDLEFKYDGTGNRILKIAKPRTSSGLSNETDWVYTYYLRDAQGNIMSVYNVDYLWQPYGSYNHCQRLVQSEMPMYGSSMLGSMNINRVIAENRFNYSGFDGSGEFVKTASENFMGDGDNENYQRGVKQFELTNHLGNVLATVSDRKDFELGDNVSYTGDWVTYNGATYTQSGTSIEVTSSTLNGAINRNFTTSATSTYYVEVDMDLTASNSADAWIEIWTVETTPVRIKQKHAQNGKNCFTFEAQTTESRIKFVRVDPTSAGTKVFEFDNLTISNEISYFADVKSASFYYPFGMLEPGKNYNANEYRFGFNGQENENEWDGQVGSKLDFGARIYDSRLGRWLACDPLAAKYPELSPYTYVGNMPIEAIDINGEDIYIIIYTENNSSGDKMFKEAAETRAKAIKNSNEYNPKTDIVVMISVSDISDIETKVEKNIDLLSPVWGGTKEVGIWSHAGADGPSGSGKASKNNLSNETGQEFDENQMTLDGWGQIDWNWTGNKNRMGVYGCNSEKFAKNISSSDNMENVSVSGQPYSSYPSRVVDKRENDDDIIDETYSSGENVYLVAVKQYYLIINTSASEMIIFKNGEKTGEKYQTGEKYKYDDSGSMSDRFIKAYNLK